MSELDPIEYLLNAMEAAALQTSVTPFAAGYADKRQAVLSAIRELRERERVLREALRDCVLAIEHASAQGGVEWDVLPAARAAISQGQQP